MPITDDTQRIAIASIIVLRDERQRREFKTEDLEKSIARVGLLQPIIITRDFVLKAGERRLTACQKLGHETILVRFAEDLSPIEARVMELEENLKRQDLEWLDQTRAIGDIHALYRALDPDWTMTETADALSMAPGQCSNYLRVYGELQDAAMAEKLAKAGTMREAYNQITRRDNRLAGDALEDLLAAPEVSMSSPNPLDETDLPEEPYELPTGLAGNSHPVATAGLRIWPAPIPIAPQESILCKSFLEWAPAYSGPKFSLVHCDFPYGVNLFDGLQGRGSEPTEGYVDTEDTYWTLLECFCRELDRFMSISSHLMFWYSAKHERRTRETFARLAPSLNFTTFPLIWHKSDNAGIASDPRHGPRHVYETCLLASKGKRQIVKVVGDLYSCPTDKRLHVSTKPVPMLKHFMTMLVDSTSTMLDPTCGSGAALRAAEELGAARVLGLEIDQACTDVARRALGQDRSLRALSRAAR